MTKWKDPIAEAMREGWNEAIEAAAHRVQAQFWRLPHYQQNTENNLEDKVEEGYGNALTNVLAAIRSLHKPTEESAAPNVTREVTRDEIEAARTPDGGWTRETLAGWGVGWPPPAGWKQRLIGESET